MELTGFGNETLPSVIKDPFSKNQVIGITVWFSKSHFSDKWEAVGKIEFKNGDTEAEQRFKGDTFDEVVLKIKACLENL